MLPVTMSWLLSLNCLPEHFNLDIRTEINVKLCKKILSTKMAAQKPEILNYQC